MEYLRRMVDDNPTALDEYADRMAHLTARALAGLTAAERSERIAAFEWAVKRVARVTATDEGTLG